MGWFDEQIKQRKQSDDQLFEEAFVRIADAVLAVVCGNIPVLNIRWPGILLPLLLAWYILTELGSILENAIAMGANAPHWLTAALGATLKAVDDLGEKTHTDL